MIRSENTPGRSLACSLTLLATLLLATSPCWATETAEKAEPPSPSFNRLYDFDQVEELLQGYQQAYPEWLELVSLGKSAEGRDIWLLTLNNPATGQASSKPAMYVDGNTHANEVQGTEIVLYLIDFLLRNHGQLERITELLDRAAFYFVPVVNPDGRAMWFRGPSTASFPRTVMVPVDDDRDGRADEDGYDDLDGDGIITTMRKRVPLGEGSHRQHPDDPRLLVAVSDEQLGDWLELGGEGIDNDLDGRVNEDSVGYVDPNRTWGFDWQPPYVQNGAGAYPLSIPESRSIAHWAHQTPNIAAAQTFHNAGKMILRGPGAKAQADIPATDLAAFDRIAEEGERMLPGYRYLVSWRDLYTAYGTTDSHFYRIAGAISFTNELYKPPTDLDGDGESSAEETLQFNDLLTLGRQFVSWNEIDHPQYGKVEIGGWRHDVGRVPEGWLLEEETHRNAAFVLFHAHQLPKLRFGKPRLERLANDLWQLQLPVHNERAIPTVTELARRNKIHRVDVATVDGAQVLSSGVVDDPWLRKIQLQQHRPERLMVDGIDGAAHQTLFFLLSGSGEVTVRYDSLKGGAIELQLELTENDQPPRS